MLNFYENTLIKNSKLPDSWKSQTAQNELLEFLQSNWEQRGIFYDDGAVVSKQQFLDFTGQQAIKTKDYVGTIVFKGEQLNIFPKIFRESKEDNDTDELTLPFLMHNLVKWIEYSSKVDYPYISISTDIENTNDLQELFVSLYVRYVKSALDRGLFYRYEEQNEDEKTIKGRFDIKDYFTKKYPNGILDKFKCSYTTFEFDNLLNRIIKCTLKHVFNIANRSNQKMIRALLNKLGEVSDVHCTPSDCDRITLSKMHGNYRVILSMSKMFLWNKTSTYTMDSQESFCFLFPTDVLFEGFIGGFIQSILMGQAKISLQADEVSLIDNMSYGSKEFGPAFALRHDILVEHKEKGLFILDTKYKMLSPFSEYISKNDISRDVSQPDLYQMYAYASKRGLDKVYLLYPQFRLEEPNDTPLIMTHRLKEEGKTVRIYALRIPFVFNDDDSKTIENLRKVLLSVFE